MTSNYGKCIQIIGSRDFIRLLCIFNDFKTLKSICEISFRMFTYTMLIERSHNVD